MKFELELRRHYFSVVKRTLKCYLSQDLQPFIQLRFNQLGVSLLILVSIPSLERDQRHDDMSLFRCSQVAHSSPRRTRTAPRRPDRALYTPPEGRAAVAPSPAVLFKLEYCDVRSGAVRHQPFVQGEGR